MKTRGRYYVLLVAAVLLASGAAVAADVIGTRQALELLRHFGGANWSKDQVEIKKIIPGTGSGGGVIVEARIETAFRMVKEKRDWRIVEVRFGDQQWESLELVEEAVRREKIRRTQAQLKELSEGLVAYQRDHQQFAVTDDTGQLLDYLAPRYLKAPPRFDLWGKQFQYRGTARKYRLSSSGPDLKPGTGDDLVVEGGQ